MKKWQIIAPIGIAAAAAAAVLAMRKKPQAAADAKPAPAAKKPAPAAQLKTGSYSFVSGYKDAATVEVKVGYDPERFSFAVIEDSFPAYSSDSHVAVIYGEDFTAQIEYAGYYHGEDFAAMSAAARGKFQGFGEIEFGALRGIRYIDGDCICMCFPVPGDEYSYLLVTVVKAEGNDDTLDELQDDENLAALLGSVEISSEK